MTIIANITDADPEDENRPPDPGPVKWNRIRPDVYDIPNGVHLKIKYTKDGKFKTYQGSTENNGKSITVHLENATQEDRDFLSGAKSVAWALFEEKFNAGVFADDYKVERFKSELYAAGFPFFTLHRYAFGVTLIKVRYEHKDDPKRIAAICRSVNDYFYSRKNPGT